VVPVTHRLLDRVGVQEVVGRKRLGRIGRYVAPVHHRAVKREVEVASQHLAVVNGEPHLHDVRIEAGQSSEELRSRTRPDRPLPAALLENGVVGEEVLLGLRTPHGHSGFHGLPNLVSRGRFEAPLKLLVARREREHLHGVIDTAEARQVGLLDPTRAVDDLREPHSERRRGPGEPRQQSTRGVRGRSGAQHRTSEGAEGHGLERSCSEPRPSEHGHDGNQPLAIAGGQLRRPEAGQRRGQDVGPLRRVKERSGLVFSDEAAPLLCIDG